MASRPSGDKQQLVKVVNYFVSDFVKVRKEVNAVTGLVENKAVIVEVKLKNATDLTSHLANVLVRACTFS